VDETRPLLQGSRLTAWELVQLGIEHTLVVDAAGPSVLARGLADAVVVGADRIAANGDVINKIGTYPLALAAARSGIPVWQDEMLQSLEKLASDITGEMARYLAKLDALTKRVDQALRRVEVNPDLSASLQAIVPWGVDALTSLDRRTEGGAAGECPLPELFGAVRAKHATLTVRDFHDGLRRLSDNGAVRLTPWAGPGAMPQPEYALMADGRLMYHVGR
jgi:hypothetical protein